MVTRGCFTGTKEDFLEKSAKVHDEKTQREYRLLIEVAESRIKHHKAPEPTTPDQERLRGDAEIPPIEQIF